MTEVKHEALKPCPMCGPNTVVECYKDEYGKWRVACGACGLHGGIEPHNRKAIVIYNWNQRRPEPIKGSREEIEGPHGTIICHRCQSIQCGRLDFICDGCGMPLWVLSDPKPDYMMVRESDQRKGERRLPSTDGAWAEKLKFAKYRRSGKDRRQSPMENDLWNHPTRRYGKERRNPEPAEIEEIKSNTYAETECVAKTNELIRQNKWILNEMRRKWNI